MIYKVQHLRSSMLMDDGLITLLMETETATGKAIIRKHC